jgi:DeoR family ulaG and ulaABCDEF operon transcriptional repressor
MLERERKITIARLLDLRGFATIHDIVEATGASEATIRRDFGEMERTGSLLRVRGGVELSGARSARGALSADAAKLGEVARAGPAEPPLDSRLGINQEKKRRIARQACLGIRPGDTIMIDGGSTTYHMAEFLAGMAITVVTNSFAIAEHLVRHSECTVILPEGVVNPNSRLILNNLCADPFANYNASVAFMGVEGISETTLSNSDPLLIQMERAMIARSRELVILADETKFGTIGHLTLCPTDRATRIITTKDADREMVGRLREKGIEIVTV